MASEFELEGSFPKQYSMIEFSAFAQSVQLLSMVDTRNQFPFDFTASAEYEDLDEVVIATTQVTIFETCSIMNHDIKLGLVQISAAKAVATF